MSKKHTFNVAFSPARVFELILENFSVALSWYNPVKIKAIKFTAVVALLINIIVTQKIKRIKFTINNALVKILQNLPVTLNIKKIKFTAIMRMIEQWVQTAKIKKVKITATLRQLLRLANSTTVIKKIKFVAISTIAQFKVLSYFDPYYLSDWDASNLSDMDYIIAP